ncbi:MAG: DNA repair protein RecO [Rhodobacteraceae bacterium]|nr:DNA repair protein RecO [Paracoccaceae bacterium]
MRWEDQGVLLSVRRHGEGSAIIDVLTAEHGRHAGVVRGGASRKLAPILQPGAQLAMSWTARLESHIGTASVEPLKSRAADLMQDRMTLSALNSVCALLAFALPEREPQEEVYAATISLLDMIGANPAWALAYLKWEVLLLEATGFGLDLTRCAVTGSTDDLIYVSPKTGRAVSGAGAGDWADRLLPLGPALRDGNTADPGEILAGLRVTGHFLETHLAPSLGNRPLPDARIRFLSALERRV